MSPPPRARLPHALETASGVLFLCSGNMIRSAFAELYARHAGCPLPVASAATLYDNDEIYAEAARALLARGVDPARIDAFRPTLLRRVEHVVDPEAVVFGMTRDHLEALTRPELAARAFLLPALLGNDDEIADPFFEGGYDGTFATIEAAVDALIDRLHERA